MKITVTILPFGVSAYDANQPKRVPLLEQVPVLPSTGNSWNVARSERAVP